MNTPRPAPWSRAVGAGRPVAALGGWTIFLWATRIKNALADDTMSRGGKTVAVVTSVGFVAVAVAVMVVYVRRSRRATSAATAFATASIVYWLVRAATILARDRSVGFKVVHTVLALITVGLAAWVLRAMAGRSSGRNLTRTPV